MSRRFGGPFSVAEYRRIDRVAADFYVARVKRLRHFPLVVDCFGVQSDGMVDVYGRVFDLVIHLSVKNQRCVKSKYN